VAENTPQTYSKSVVLLRAKTYSDMYWHTFLSFALYKCDMISTNNVVMK